MPLFSPWQNPIGGNVGRSTGLEIKANFRIKKKKRILRGNYQKLLKSSTTENFQDKRETKLSCQEKREVVN